MRLIALLWGVFGVACIVGLYWPRTFSKVNLDGFFENPPKWLKSTAFAGIIVGATFDMNPLIAAGVVILWGRRFPGNFSWLRKWNFFGSAPGWWEAGIDWLKLETGISLGAVAWPVLVDMVGIVLALVGLTIWLHSFSVGALVVVAAIAIVLWVKLSGNTERVTHIFGSL
jgi:hypothetical protein